MANVKIYSRGSKNPATLYVRLYSGRNLDVNAKTGLLVNPTHWDNSQSNYRNISAVRNKAVLRARINKLKLQIVEDYTESYMLGDVIDRAWLESCCHKFFSRPQQEVRNKIETHYIYFTEFSKWWINNKSKSWKCDSDTFLSKRIISQYNAFIDLWEEYEANSKIKIWDIGSQKLDEFALYLVEVLEYAPSTTKRMLGRARFFINRAKDLSIKTDNTASNRVYVKNVDHDIEVPYLSEDEINRIYNLDYADNYKYDNIRDNAIIGCWTGLRISDFNHQLDVSKIKDNFIKIRTTKTGTWVTIPLHPHVKAIIQKRFGALPAKTSDEVFNEGIKVICKEAGVDKVMPGGVVKVDDNTNRMRKVYGNYKKYELISSHVCRRSFATNLYGQVNNNVIMSVAGWKSEDMFLHYIKKTRLEGAIELQDHWKNKYNQKPNQNA